VAPRAAAAMGNRLPHDDGVVIKGELLTTRVFNAQYVKAGILY
jgi:hypothetical protein